MATILVVDDNALNRGVLTTLPVDNAEFLRVVEGALSKVGRPA